MTATNTWGGSGLLSRTTSARTVCYAFDPQGNVSQAIDPNAPAGSQILNTCSADAYGYRYASSTYTDPYMGFGGQYGYYTDAETGLQLLGHRFYDSAAGRFINRDPIGYKGDINLYGYCGSNSVNYVDPSGFKEEQVHDHSTPMKPDLPVVYICLRYIFGGLLDHQFFWIHYPGTLGNDLTVGYGPKDCYERGNVKYAEPQQPDDMDAVNHGSARCYRVDCKAADIIKAGSHIRTGDPDWDPADYYPWHNCIHFCLAVADEHDDCDITPPWFEFNPGKGKHVTPKIRTH